MRVEARRVLQASTAVSNYSHVPHDPLICAGDWGCHGLAVSLSGLLEMVALPAVTDSWTPTGAADEAGADLQAMDVFGQFKVRTCTFS